MAEKLEAYAQGILNKADIKINGGRKGDIKVNNSRFYKRVLSHGSMGLGESYMDGDWDSNGLDVFFYKLLGARLDRSARNFSTITGYAARYLVNIITNPQSMRKSKIVAEQHYNLGNDLYEAMLGKTMQYTCAYWKNAKTLDQAQENKLKLVAEKLKLKPGMTVLELGGGFGYLAYYLAKNYKVKVESYNIATEQIKYGRELCKGLPVVFHEKDYRLATGQFDRVASIGMMEHVGAKNHRAFIQLIERSLKKGGIAIVHTIGKNNTTTGTDPWINKYIFPQGQIPSLNQITKAASKLLIIEDVHNFGPDYDKTLLAWYENTNKNWSKLKPKYDPMMNGKFKRMWDYYLLCCAGAFRTRNLQLYQVILTKDREETYEAVR